MCIHLNQAYFIPPAKRFLVGAMSAACRGGYVVFCTILDDFWTGFENPRFRDLSLSQLFHLSNWSDTQILLQANQSRPFESICVGIFSECDCASQDTGLVTFCQDLSIFLNFCQLFNQNFPEISPREIPRNLTPNQVPK